MKQRINLYQQPQKTSAFSLDWQSLTGSAVIVAVVTVVSLLVGLGLNLYTGQKQQQLAALTTQKQQLEAQVQTLQAAFSNQAVSPKLIDEKLRLETEIASRAQLLTLLSQLNPEQTISFSSYLYALAVASPEDSWLTAFVLDGKDARFSMQGEALSGPAVPGLFSALGETEAFSGLGVTALEVEATVSGGVRFSANTELQVND